MVSKSYQLVMKTGPTPGKSYPLEQGEVRIGRDVNNEVVINDAEVSRKHARITVQGNTYVLEDLGSTNGTFVNGQRLTSPHMLLVGQTISLGENISLGFEAPPYDPDATMVGTVEEFYEEPLEPTPPPPVEAYTPPPVEAYTPPPQPPEPVFAGQVPPGQPEPVTQARRTSPWLIGGCGCLIIILCIVLVAALWYVDSNAMWCELLPFIPGCQ